MSTPSGSGPLLSERESKVPNAFSPLKNKFAFGCCESIRSNSPPVSRTFSIEPSGVLLEDRDAATAEGGDHVDIAVAVGIALVIDDVQAAQIGVLLQRGLVQENRVVEVVAAAAEAHLLARQARADARIALVRGHEIGFAADREGRDRIRLQQRADLPGPDVDAVLVGGVERVAGERAVDRAEREDRKRAGCGRIGQVDHRDRVDLLQRDIGARPVGRYRDVFRLDVGRSALPREQRQTKGPVERSLAAVERGEADGALDGGGRRPRRRRR